MFWGKCKEELLYGYLELSRHLLWKILKQLQASSPLSFTFKNLQIDRNYAYLHYSIIILFSHLCVVATTRQNGTYDMLTSAKLSVGYLVVGITRELDKELLLYCSSML